MVLYRWQKINEQVFCSDCCIDIIISLNLFGFWIKKKCLFNVVTGKLSNSLIILMSYKPVQIKLVR